MENEDKKEDEIEASIYEALIPQYCREGWESCIHVAKKEKPKKQNIGL